MNMSELRLPPNLLYGAAKSLDAWPSAGAAGKLVAAGLPLARVLPAVTLEAEDEERMGACRPQR